MLEFRTSSPQDGGRILEIWRAAVDATHHFLSQEDRAAIEKELAVLLPQMRLTLAVDPLDGPVGFMLLQQGHMEALFVDPRHHGHGVGKALVGFALRRHPDLTTDVNEQNGQAVGFYERIGFVRTGRSAVDGQGRRYPLIHLRFQPRT